MPNTPTKPPPTRIHPAEKVLDLKYADFQLFVDQSDEYLVHPAALLDQWLAKKLKGRIRKIQSAESGKCRVMLETVLDRQVMGNDNFRTKTSIGVNIQKILPTLNNQITVVNEPRILGQMPRWMFEYIVDYYRTIDRQNSAAKKPRRWWQFWSQR